MKKNKELQFKIFTKSEEISDIIIQKDLVLFSVEGFNFLVPRFVYISFLNAVSSEQALKETQDLNEFIITEYDLNVGEILEKFEKIRKNGK